MCWPPSAGAQTASVGRRGCPGLTLNLPSVCHCGCRPQNTRKEVARRQRSCRARGGQRAPHRGPGVLSYLHCCWGEPARPTPSHQSPVLSVSWPILYGLFCPKAMAPAWMHPGLTSLPELLSASLVFISLCLGQLGALFSEQSPPAPSLGHLLLREDPMDTPAPVAGQPQCPCTSLASTVGWQVLGGGTSGERSQDCHPHGPPGSAGVSACRNHLQCGLSGA